MKRQGPVSDEERDRKRPSVIAVAANNANEDALSFNLMDFADEIHKRVFSFLPLKDRQVTRRVCRQLLKFVEESTPGALKLSIRLDVTRFRSWQESITFKGVKMRPSVVCLESVLVEIKLLCAVSDIWQRGRSLQQVDLAKLLSSLPPLTSIRPKTVFIEVPSLIDSTRGLFTGLMHHLINQQVSKSVTELALSSWEQLGTRSDVEQAFSAFERSSHCGVQTLKLAGHCPEFLPTVAAVCFTRLVSLEFDLPTGNPEAALVSWSGHPTLRELKISNRFVRPEIEVNLMTSLAAFKNIRKLDVSLNCYRAREDHREAYCNAFGNMLRGMQNLECLGILYRPPIQLWQYLMENKVTNNSVQELRIRCGDYWTHEELDAMIRGLLYSTPSLSTLNLHLCIYTERSKSFWDGDGLIVLSALRHHSTLSEVKVKLETNYPFAENKLSTLQRALGDHVKVSRISSF